MLELFKGGAYLKNGTELIADSDIEALTRAGIKTDDASKAQAKKGTMAYGILAAHDTADTGSVSPDDVLKIKFDKMTSHDITFVGIIQTARASGMTEFPMPLRSHQLPQLALRGRRHDQRGRPRFRTYRCQEVRRNLRTSP